MSKLGFVLCLGLTLRSDLKRNSRLQAEKGSSADERSDLIRKRILLVKRQQSDCKKRDNIGKPSIA